MVDTGIFATTAQIGYKAGAGKSSTSSAEAYTNFYIGQAEAYINTYCNYNYSDAYSGLNNDKKYLLQEAASNIAAMYVMIYDLSGYPSLAAAQTMLNVLWARAVECMNILKSTQANDFVKAA